MFRSSLNVMIVTDRLTFRLMRRAFGLRGRLGRLRRLGRALPQLGGAAILAVGAGVKKPVVGKDGELSVATVMSVTLSVDHRVIDGALGAQLLQAIIDNLEAPMLMLA